MTRLNLHALFYSTTVESLLDAISLRSDERRDLESARAKIRAHLRSQLKWALQKQHVEETKDPVVRFYTQGSYTYKTINAPNRPPQQADLDDGVYFPLSYCENAAPPKQLSGILFAVVEGLLRELAQRERWPRVESNNPNCTRVVIAEDKHVDVPIYSIPDAEFHTLSERAHTLAKRSIAFDEFMRASDLDDDWSALPTEKVLLAHKIKGWTNSDPRPIKDWVERQTEIKTEQLRRLMRYVKAWRDQQAWPSGDPKSLLLMVAVDQALREAVDGRDDVALVYVSERLPAILRGDIPNPTNRNDDLAKRLDEDGIRQVLIERVDRLNDVLRACVSGRHTAQQVCDLLRGEWGTRFPDRPDRVHLESPEEVVRSVRAREIPVAPFVGRKNSG